MNYFEFKDKIILFFTIIFFISCAGVPNQYPKGDLYILLLSDIQLSNDKEKDERLRKFVNSINNGRFNNLKALFTTGDNVSSFYRYKEKRETDGNKRAAKFIDIISHLEIPYFLALGNHDYKIHSDRNSSDDAVFTQDEIDTMEVLWKKLAGIEPYYSRSLYGFKFIIMNSMRGRYLTRAFDPEQIKWFKNELKDNKPAILFFHHPLETDNIKHYGKHKPLITAEKEREFFSLLKNNKSQIKGIFVGHGHKSIMDSLFEEIPVYMTDSFADNVNSPYRLIGIDTVSNTIDVKKYE